MKNNRHRPASMQAHCKVHASLAYPMIIGKISIILTSIANHIIVGRLGTSPLAALVLVSSIIIPILSFCIGVGYCLTPLITSASAKLDYQNSIQLFKHALIINIILGCFFYVIITLCAPLVHHIGQTPTVAYLAEKYFRVVAKSFIPFMIFWSLKDYIVGFSFTRALMYINTCCSAFHIMLEYILVYGFLEIQPVGFIGSAWAIFISNIFRIIITAGYILLTLELRKTMVNVTASSFKRTYFKKILQLGIPSGLRLMLETSTYMFLCIMLGWINKETQAAYTVANNLIYIGFFTVGGIATATAIRVGKEFGMQSFIEIQKMGLVGLLMGKIVMAVAFVLIILGGTYLPTRYTDEVSVLKKVPLLIIIVGILEFFSGLIRIITAALRGIEDTTIPLISTACSHCIIGLPLSYYLGFVLNWEIKGIALGFGVAQVLDFSTLIIRFILKINKLKKASKI